MEWAQTQEAQPYIKESHFIDNDLERIRLQDMGMTLIHTAAEEEGFNANQYVELAQQLRNSDRLSTSFRFTAGESKLDPKSRANLIKLAGVIDQGEFDGQEILLVGFTDSNGRTIKNAALGQARADEVRKFLANVIDAEAIKKVKLVAMSFGELLPLSCNTTAEGRSRNRRVEVWVRTPADTATN